MRNSNTKKTNIIISAFAALSLMTVNALARSGSSSRSWLALALIGGAVVGGGMLSYNVNKCTESAISCATSDGMNCIANTNALVPPQTFVTMSGFSSLNTATPGTINNTRVLHLAVCK